VADIDIKTRCPFYRRGGRAWGEVLGITETADGTIPSNRLVEINASGEHVVGTAASHTIVGVNMAAAAVAATQEFPLGWGVCSVVSATPILAGTVLKGADNGRVTRLADADTVSGTIMAVAAGGGFANQPANDGVEVVSSSAADTTRTATIIGTTNGGVVVVVETVTLNGVTFVPTVKVDWGLVLAVKLSAACVGTITVREASHDAAIITLAPGVLSAGVTAVTATTQGAYNTIPSVVADGASTKVAGMKYTQNNGTTVAYQAVAQNGATAAPFATAALLVTEVYTGDVAGATASTFAVSATEEDEFHKVGKALTTATAAGQTITALIQP
jgi:hypothetical protein